MTGNPTEDLIYGLRDARLWSEDQVARAIGRVTGIQDANVLAEALKECGPLTSYQIRKIRHGRIVDLTLGPFVIQEKIGEGGMGKVYKAVSSKLGKTVALKVVRSHLMSNKTVLRRYKREAAAAAALDHPNIVTLLDADEYDGRYYLAMEFVDGSDLSRLVKENGPLPPQEAAEYIRQSALGLQHAHDRGLIHRDIKPSNLLVSGDRALPGTDGQSHLKILDMGLVRSIMDSDDVSRTELTRDGTVVGTPDYMAPEQAKNSSKVDAKADLYSLGATLYYLLRGQAPFPDGSPIDKLLRHQLDQPPDLRQFRKDLPAGLVAIVTKLMKKNPDERFASANDLAIAIQPFTPSADLGTVLSPDAEGVTLDLPAAAVPENGPLVMEAEIVEATSVSTAKTRPPKSKPIVRKAARKPIVRSTVPVSGDPNSGSLPGSDSVTRMPGATPPRLVKNRPADRSGPPRVPYRKPGANPNRKMVGFAIAGASIILLLIASIAMLSSGKNSKTSEIKTSTPSKKGPNGSTVQSGPTGPPNEPKPATSATLARTEVVIGDNSIAALAIYPQQHWKRTIYEMSPHPHQTGWLKWVISQNGFDTTRLDRIVISFLPDKQTITFGEGNGLNETWLRRMKQQYTFEQFDAVSRNMSVYYARGGSVKPIGLLFGLEAMAIGQSDMPIMGQNPLRRFGIRYSNKKVANNVDSFIPNALPKAAAEDPPFVTFAANKNWQLPDNNRSKLLFDYGVTSLVAKVRIDGEDYAVELTVTGESETRLKTEFISLGLATHLIEKLPSLQPFVEPISLATPEVETKDGKTVLTIRAKWPISDAQNWLETLLGPPPAN